MGILSFGGGASARACVVGKPEAEPVGKAARGKQRLSDHFAFLFPNCFKFFLRNAAAEDQSVPRASCRYIEQAQFFAQHFTALPLPRQPIGETWVAFAGVRRFDLRTQTVLFIEDDVSSQIGNV